MRNPNESGTSHRCRQESPSSISGNILYAVVIALYAAYFLQDRFLLNAFYDGIATPSMLVDGTAYLPFQTRVLIPWLVYAIQVSGVLSGLSDLYIFSIIDFLSIVGVMYATRYYLMGFFSDKVLASVLSCILFYILPFHFTKTMWYPWDLPSIMFFTLGLAFLQRRRWGSYYLLFTIATINRETTFLLIIMYMLSEFDKTKWFRLCLGLFSQLVIWTTIRYGLYALYAGNPKLGYGAFELQFWKNLVLLQNPKIWIKALSAFGFLWVPVLVWYARTDNEFVKRSLWLVPLMYVLMAVIGVVYELRIYGECIPMVASAFCLNLRRIGAQERMVRTPIE